MYETKKQHDARVTRTMIVFMRIVEVNEHKRSTYDQRRFVTWTLCEYRDPSTNDEYRVAFESKGPPAIPKSGFLREVNTKRKQW